MTMSRVRGHVWTPDPARGRHACRQGIAARRAPREPRGRAAGRLDDLTRRAFIPFSPAEGQTLLPVTITTAGPSGRGPARSPPTTPRPALRSIRARPSAGLRGSSAASEKGASSTRPDATADGIATRAAMPSRRSRQSACRSPGRPSGERHRGGPPARCPRCGSPARRPARADPVDQGAVSDRDGDDAGREPGGSRLGQLDRHRRRRPRCVDRRRR